MDGKELVSTAADSALAVQSARARSTFERLRRVHPDDTPRQLAKRITRNYLLAVTASGGATAAARAIPGEDVPAAVLDVVAFAERSVLYLLTLAEVHGIHPEDDERRRFLVRTVLIGDSAIATLDKGANELVPHWGRRIVKAIPRSAVDKANTPLRHNFITKYGESGTVVLSKQVPFGLGIGVGALSSHLTGWAIVAAARKVFGPASESFEPRPGPLVVDAEWVEAGRGRLQRGGDPPQLND